MEFKYQYATVAGTFDRLHKGHASILERAFSVAKKLYIALSSDEFAANKSQNILPYEVRKQELEDYVSVNGYDGRYFIKQLDDIYGDSITDPTLEAIIVTSETKTNAEKINSIRKEKGFKPLSIEVVPFEKNNDEVISSTKIREGLTDRRGNRYIDIFKRNLQLPDSLREELRKPIGEVMSSTEQAKKFIEEKKSFYTIAVGDVVAEELQKAGVKIYLSVIDLKTQRKELTSDYKGEKFNNPAGTIQSATVWELASRIWDSALPSVLVIDGEEDLLTLPAIMLSPLGSLVVYGQKDLGVIMVEVTERLKQRLRLEVLDRFVTLG